MDDPVTDYALKVLDGTLPAGPYVIWACERHMVDLQREDIYLDLKAVHRWIGFFARLKHYKGKFYGRPVELSLWQIFRVGSVMGWKWRETGKRRYRVSFNKVPRKNGKTTEMAGIGTGGLVIDDEPGAEIYSVATRRDQARIVFDDGQAMIGMSHALRKRLKCYKTSIVYHRFASKWIPVSRDSKGMDGFNPHFGLYDEFAQWTDWELRGKFRQGMGSREQPLEWIITTEGVEVESPCCELTDHAVRVLDPEQTDFKDDTLFAYLACPFKEDDPGSVETWARANPNLGVSKSVKDMADLWTTAQSIRTDMTDFLTYQLNVLVGSTDAWLDVSKWRECGKEPVDADALIGQRCYAGLDLALVNDLSALLLVFPDIEPMPVLAYFWCPEEDIRKRSKDDKVPYDQWARDGYITATPGNATDFAFIKSKILEVCGRYDVRELLYDRALAQPMVQELIEEEVNCVGYGQGYLSQNNSLREIERRVTSGGLSHGGHPILDWNATNARVMRDPANGIKLYKKDPRKRIDGLAALSNAFGGVVLSRPEEKKKNPYSKDRGMRSL